MEQYWLIYDGTGSVEGGTGRYLMVLGQKKAVLVDTWWYWVSMGQYWSSCVADIKKLWPIFDLVFRLWGSQDSQLEKLAREEPKKEILLKFNFQDYVPFSSGPAEQV